MSETAFSPGVEVISIKQIGDGWEEAQLAVDGTLCVPFQFHSSQVEHMSTAEREQFLERQARTYISRYGDAREPKPEELVMAQEAQTAAEMREAF